jgi:hypothetical protein
VAPLLTMTTASTSLHVGDSATFVGTVDPDEAGRVIQLLELGGDGQFHDVASTVIGAASEYSVAFALGAPGALEFRTLLVGGPRNAGAASKPVAIAVSLPPLTSLPMA